MPASPEINLLDLANYGADGQPHGMFRWLRENDPVHWHAEPGGSGFWAVTRYDDVRRVSKDAVTYSSWRGGIMIGDSDEAGLAGSRNMMLFMDEPAHTRYRNLVSRGFTPGSAQKLGARIQELARLIIDEVIERGECDFVSEIAGKLPSYFIADLMGIPLEDGVMLYEWTELMHSDAAVVGPERQQQATQNMLAYAAGVAARKRQHPAEDLATTIIQSEIEGDKLSDMEFVWFFLLLVNAGGDTTRNLLAGGLEALFANPGERQRLQSNIDPLLPTAVEEMLRFVSPVVHMRRTATRDAQLGGKTIREGDKVVMFYGSANRDAAKFADPDRFDVGRTPNDHIAFGGGGPHFCLGIHLARIEISAMLREVLTRLPDIRPAGEVERLPSIFIAGPRNLPVRFTPGARSS